MKKGDYVRRITPSTGIEYGPWMVVINGRYCGNRHMVEAKPIGIESNDIFVFEEDKIIHPKVPHIVISPEEMNDIVHGKSVNTLIRYVRTRQNTDRKHIESWQRALRYKSGSKDNLMLLMSNRKTRHLYIIGEIYAHKDECGQLSIRINIQSIVNYEEPKRTQDIL